MDPQYLILHVHFCNFQQSMGKARIALYVVVLLVVASHWKVPGWSRHLFDIGMEMVSSAGLQHQLHRDFPTLYALNPAVKDADGKPYNLLQHQGKDVLLIMNVASECGLTKSGYETAVELHKKYREQGFEVLGFPCNQFGAQEPGPESQVVEFASNNFKVEFPILEKVDVNGPDAHPLWKYLTAVLPGTLGSRRIKWNFTMFLVDRNGKPVHRFTPGTPTAEIEAELVRLLKSTKSASSTKASDL